jgi:anti-sigma factor RsiW
MEAHESGTLDNERTMAMENHFEICPGCRQEWENLHILRTALGKRTLYRHAPVALREQISGALSRADREESFIPILSNVSWRHLATSGVVAVIAFMAGGVWHPFSMGSVPVNGLISEVVSDHVRSLQPNHLMDVVSTDQHTVKPWFNGKLDFAPPVVDLKEQGFPLMGGRLDAIKGHPVAALVYRRHQHIINLLVWPTADTGQTGHTGKITHTIYRGYHVLTWQTAEMTCYAVSDLNEQELTQFVQELKL